MPDCPVGTTDTCNWCHLFGPYDVCYTCIGSFDLKTQRGEFVRITLVVFSANKTYPVHCSFYTITNYEGGPKCLCLAAPEGFNAALLVTMGNVIFDNTFSSKPTKLYCYHKMMLLSYGLYQVREQYSLFPSWRLHFASGTALFYCEV
jgi:hypothetical protein